MSIKDKIKDKFKNQIQNQVQSRFYNIKNQIHDFIKKESIINYDDDESVILSIDEFWSDNRSYDDDIITITPKAKKIMRCCLITIIVIVCLVLVYKVGNKIYKNSTQEKVYNLALQEVKSSSFSSAISHFEKIEEDSKYYYDAKKYIRKLNNVQRYCQEAQDFFDTDELALALEKVNSVEILIPNYKPAVELKKQILERIELKKADADKFIKEGLEFIAKNDYKSAYEKIIDIDRIYPNYKPADELKQKVINYAISLTNKAIEFYKKGNITEASKLNSQALEISPDLKEASSLANSIQNYNDAVKIAEQSRVLLARRKYVSAKEMINKAIEKSDVIKINYADLIKAIDDSERVLSLINQYKTKFSISEVSCIDTGTESEPQLTVMFDIQNISGDLFQFNVFWCSVLTESEEISPTPYSNEQMGVIVKINPDGSTSSELEPDYLYMQNNDKYRVLLNFAGSRESLKGNNLYYTDFNTEDKLKVDLFEIS